MTLLGREHLHPYQRYCVDFVKSHQESVLILQMGLGKTISALTAITDLTFDSFDIGKTLIIAPLRVCTQVWPAEREKWEQTQILRMSVITGSEKNRIAAMNKDADVYVLNRENVPWLIGYLEKHHRPWIWDCVCIDELSSFKNFKSQRWRALRKARPYIKHMIGLTGTPSSNGLMDLFGEIGIIDGGKRLGRFIGKYREAYFKPGAMNPYSGVVYEYTPIPEAETLIYDKISDICVSMKTADYLQMPDKVTVEHYVDMSPTERGKYDQLKQQMVVSLDGETVDAVNAAVLSGKLLQLSSGAIYNDSRDVIHVHDRKLDMLEDLIEQACGQPLLVAYWFQHDRQRIMDRLMKCGYVPRDMKTDADFADWNAGKIQVGLISPGSAAHGLNLQFGGSQLIWFSMVWSLELVQQTEARLWRQGQKNAVIIHYILCRNTIDEDVVKAIQNKDATQERLIAAVKANI